MKPWHLFFAVWLMVGCLDSGTSSGSTVGSTAATTTSSGAPGSGGSGASSSEGGAGAVGATGGAPDSCADQGVGEPNNTKDTATELAGGSDCDELSTMGTIDGSGDVDWYVYVQTGDEAGCNVNPARDWSVASDHALRVCKYVECQIDGMSPETVDCNDGSTPDTQGGLSGCCHTEPFNVGIGLFGCSGSDDLLNVYTSVEEPDAAPDTCAEYNLNYTF